MKTIPAYIRVAAINTQAEQSRMKIALIGYGAMGQLVGKLAVDRGHQIALTLDLDAADRSVEDLADALRACDVSIDFSIASAVPKDVESCARAGVPLVVGTTA